MTNKKTGFFGKSANSEMASDDQAFLSQIEENIRSKANDQADAASEAEHRAREMERLRQSADKIKVPGLTAPAQAAPAPASPEKKQNPLENDPRYKEYFERLRKQKGEGSGATPPSGLASQEIRTNSSDSAPASQKVGPGSIVRFDDGSIGIYKDAVSGRDYALFYFLHPDGPVVPEGVFLQCYQARVIGQLPENFFAQLREADTWDRDLIVFHLARYEYVGDLNKLAAHQERKPSHTTPLRNVVRQDNTGSVSQPPVSAPTPTSATPADGTPSQPAPASAPPASQAKEEQGLVKGRKFTIKFGGKQWEAVYWTAEDENAIVAHSTHGNWSLMRLDLSRFKDSLELGEVVDSETLQAIAEQAIA